MLTMGLVSDDSDSPRGIEVRLFGLVDFKGENLMETKMGQNGRTLLAYLAWAGVLDEVPFGESVPTDELAKILILGVAADTEVPAKVLRSSRVLIRGAKKELLERLGTPNQYAVLGPPGVGLHQGVRVDYFEFRRAVKADEFHKAREIAAEGGGGFLEGVRPEWARSEWVRQRRKHVRNLLDRRLSRSS